MIGRQLARSGGVTITLEDDRVRRWLSEMRGTAAGDNLRKRAVSAAFRTGMKELRARWAAARFRRGGSGHHRSAIAEAVKFSVRRQGGEGGVISAELGISYKASGKADGRQRVYHLIERGYTHRSGLRVGARGISAAWLQSRGRAILELVHESLAVQFEKLAKKRGL